MKSFKQDKHTQIAQIALVKNEAGKLAIKDSIDFDNASRDYATLGGLLGGLIGVLSGPIGRIIGYGIGTFAGAAGGSVIDSKDNSLIEEVTSKLLDGDTAVLALIQEDDESIINHVFAPYKTAIMRWDANSLAKEIEVADQVQGHLYEEFQKDMLERRLKRLKKQGSELSETIKASFKRLRGDD